MRKLLILSPLALLVACGGNPSTPPQVTWGYGAGNGDPVPAGGPAPQYSFANGLGQDMPVAAGNMPRVTRAYGADEMTTANQKVTEQMVPNPPSQMAAPATGHPAPGNPAS